MKKTLYPNVYEKLSTQNQKQYMVRFKHLKVTYPLKNFTTLYGCTTAKQTHNKLYEIKLLISKGKNPFEKSVTHTVDSYFERYISTTKGHDYYNKSTYYNKHIRPLIGNKLIENIEEKHIYNILNSKTLKDMSERTKFRLKEILNPIFQRVIRDGKRTNNPFEYIKLKKTTEKKPLHSRLVTDKVEVTRIIYKEILQIEDIELKVFFLISLMTARRRGEILKLKWCDIYGDKVFVDKTTTKTSIDDEYSLPHQVLNLLNCMKKNESNSNIFTMKKDRPTRVFTKLIQNSHIELVKDEKLTLHDTRHLFMSIMSVHTQNPILVDKCISHSHRSNIMDTYLSFSYQQRKEVFEEYWKIIRG